MRDYLPLFFLDLDPSECAGLPFKPHPETTFADLGLSAEESASILTRLAPTPVPVKDGDEAKSAIRPSKLVVFGSRTRINAALSRNGASLIHTMYASGSEDVAAQLRARVLPAGKAGESVASSSATPIGSNSPSTPREQEYRLVSYDELGKPSSLLRGQPGYLYRAYCADSPIPLLAKYSKDDDNSASMITKEARFYRQHEATLRSEELAPICLGGWSAEGTASPYTRGRATAMILLEEWGKTVDRWLGTSREARDAVRDLIVRFHFKLGCQHRSLRGDNIVWKPDVGPSSFRLMDFARSNNNCYCMRGQLCEELFELEEDLHRIDYFETLKARREAERVDQALAAVDEAERELRDQARREGELAA
ncbi:Proteophosphoglycan 5 [Rhodotorula toruloides]|nr:Proteophosphoglycan 5 [Rhodotorula toruloides]